MKRAGLFVLALILSAASFAQEELRPTATNPALYKANKVKSGSLAKSFSANKHFLYLIDTLDLPFRDDFSAQTIKAFDADSSGAGLQQIIRHGFTVDGLYTSYISYTADTQYTTYATAEGRIGYIPLPAHEIVFYDVEFPYAGIDTVWAWLAVQNANSDSNSVFTTVNNTTDTFIIVPDDGTLWTGAGAYINNTYGIDPPTVGVATFDGLDSTGLAYDIGTSTSFGRADVLTSKPIDLGGSSPSDSIYLSFYVQPQGNGNRPENEDSLVVEFYDPAENRWEPVWSKRGVLLEDFEQVFVRVDSLKHMVRGFKFRFANYATLAGNLDHWNIDYVRLEKSRSIDDEYSTDSGWRYPAKSFIKDYLSMPYEHFVLAPGTHTADNFKQRVHNLEDPTDLGANLSPMEYEILDEMGASLHGPQVPVAGSGQPFPSDVDPGDTTFVFQLNSGGNAFTFPTSYGYRTHFTVKTYYNSQNDEIISNDTLEQTQVFDSYYAYDDGSGEKGYGLIGVGARMAQRYDLPSGITDTLKAINIYFPQMLEEVDEQRFTVIVWDGTAEPGNEIYRSGFRKVIYNPDFEFVRYDISEHLEVSGTFWVGIEQRDADRIYVGFDENNDNSDRIKYDLDGTWEDTQFTGTLLIRPDFGDEPIVASTEDNKLELVANELKLWPNPTSNAVNFSVDASMVGGTYMIVSMNGQVIESGAILAERSQLDVQQLPAGLYVLRVSGKNGVVSASKRLLINR